MAPPWNQINVRFTEWDTAEPAAIAQVAPVLLDAENAGNVSSWFFTRKAPCWRLRYRPTADGADGPVRRQLDQLVTTGSIAAWTEVIYETEAHAFGGAEAMDVAHRFFHQDSRSVLSYLANEPTGPSDQRRELSILLNSLLLRTSGLDWHEQGDVWVRVAEHRTPPPGVSPDRLRRTGPALRRLMTADTQAQVQNNKPLAFANDWATAYADTGQQLSHLATSGVLRRGLRAVLAQHVIFAWNRLGLDHRTQSILANGAQNVVFGDST